MTSPTTDLRVLTELTRRADAGADHVITGESICQHLNIAADDANAIVSRLIARGLAHEVGRRRGGVKQGRFNIRPTQAGYQLVGRGLIGG